MNILAALVEEGEKVPAYAPHPDTLDEPLSEYFRNFYLFSAAF
jgi:hypothetical protein